MTENNTKSPNTTLIVDSLNLILLILEKEFFVFLVFISLTAFLFLILGSVRKNLTQSKQKSSYLFGGNNLLIKFKRVNRLEAASINILSVLFTTLRRTGRMVVCIPVLSTITSVGGIKTSPTRWLFMKCTRVSTTPTLVD